MIFLTDEKLINAFNKAIPVIENTIEEHKKNNPGVHTIEIPIWEPTEDGSITTDFGLVVKGLKEHEIVSVASEVARHFSNYDAKWVDAFARCPYLEFTV